VPRSLKIALVGSSAGIQALRLLRKTPHEMALVLASKHAAGDAAGMSLWDVAAKADVPVLAESRVKDPALADELRARGIDLLLSVRTLYIVHPQVLDAPRIGAYNMHPGPLPAYGGRNVVSWAIFNGEPRHGVTVHRMAPEVDAGPIAFERSFPIEESDSAMAVTRTPPATERWARSRITGGVLSTRTGSETSVRAMPRPPSFDRLGATTTRRDRSTG